MLSTHIGYEHNYSLTFSFNARFCLFQQQIYDVFVHAVSKFAASQKSCIAWQLDDFLFYFSRSVHEGSESKAFYVHNSWRILVHSGECWQQQSLFVGCINGLPLEAITPNILRRLVLVISVSYVIFTRIFNPRLN